MQAKEHRVNVSRLEQIKQKPKGNLRCRIRIDADERSRLNEKQNHGIARGFAGGDHYKRHEPVDSEPTARDTQRIADDRQP